MEGESDEIMQHMLPFAPIQNPRQLRRMQSPATDKVCLLARSTWRSRPPIEHPVIVTFAWHLMKRPKNRALDPDNVSHGQKYILDGLVKAGVLVDDSPAQVLALHHEFHYDTKDPYVTVTLKEAG